MIVDEPYTINEKWGTKTYQISVDSPDFNQPIHHWGGECKVTNAKKIANLRVMANIVRLKGLAEKGAEWVKIS